MTPKLIELRPNRALLDTEFSGYKLSLEAIPTFKQELIKPVDRAVPNIDQYSYLHAELFGIYNHLTGESLNGNDLIYFVDSSWMVRKVHFDSYMNGFIDFFDVWKIPKHRNRTAGDYNISLKLANEELAVISDGIGKLYVLETGSRFDDRPWNCTFESEVLGSDINFVVQDVVCKINNDNSRELHCLLYNILQKNERFVNVLYYVILSENNEKKWGQISLRELEAKGGIYYSYLEPTCGAVYVASENSFKFTVDSDNPVKEKDDGSLPKKYIWTQTSEDVTIKFKLPSDFVNKDFHVHTTQTELVCKYKYVNTLTGTLHRHIDHSLTHWSVENEWLEITLSKNDSGVMWTEVLLGDETGLYVEDSVIPKEIVERLEYLCTEIETAPQGGTTLNSQPVEECDYEEDKSIIFERICCSSHEVTHRALINSHKILLTTKLNNLPPALALRHDVDACLWQPCGNEDNFMLKHVGTLNAFGYVQASKQQRKFSACAPDLSYSVICESSRHIFIYKQQQMINGDLRHRSTGRRVGTIAQQQVFNLCNEEILGIYATSPYLYLLTVNTVYILKL